MLVSGSYLIVFLQTNMHALEQELPNGNALSSGTATWSLKAYTFQITQLELTFSEVFSVRIYIFESVLLNYLAIEKIGRGKNCHHLSEGQLQLINLPPVHGALFLSHSHSCTVHRHIHAQIHTFTEAHS